MMSATSDTTLLFDQRVQRARALLVASALRYAGVGRLEIAAVPTHDTQLPKPDDVLGRLDEIMQRMPPDEVPDQAAFRYAMSTLLKHGDAALRRLAQPLPQPGLGMNGDQLAAIEAIVITDGSRPSFLLRDGKVPSDHPFLGEWRNAVIAHAETLQAVARAVGRIEPGNGHAAQFIGTGTLIDREAGLVLTNYHVIDEARKSVGIAMERSGNTVQIIGDLMIDFGGEIGNLARNRFRVIEARLPVGAGLNPGELDAAVLRIALQDAATDTLPTQAPRLSADLAYAQGASPTLCTIGFPGPPVQISPPGAQIDWDFVVRTLFGNRFGFKRLAPGRFQSPPGSVPTDTGRRVLTHDATTFGGASGSLIFAWEDPGAPAFALHFFGKTGDANHAVSLGIASSELRDVGVPFSS